MKQKQVCREAFPQRHLTRDERALHFPPASWNRDGWRLPGSRIGPGGSWGWGIWEQWVQLSKGTSRVYNLWGSQMAPDLIRL